MSRRIRYASLRVLANASLAFFTVLGAVNFAGVNEDKAFWAAMAGAFIQGGMAGAQELKKIMDEEMTAMEKGKRPPPTKLGFALPSYLLI